MRVEYYLSGKWVEVEMVTPTYGPSIRRVRWWKRLWRWYWRRWA